MVLWNLLDGEPSHSEPLLGPFESMRGGATGQVPTRALVVVSIPTPPPLSTIKGRVNQYSYVILPDIVPFPSCLLGQSSHSSDLFLGSLGDLFGGFLGGLFNIPTM
jgi:hypothetical protein